jgi:hypothetical protein
MEATWNIFRIWKNFNGIKLVWIEPKPFEKHPLLQAFHEQRFMFSVHNVAYKQAIGSIYKYKLEVPSVLAQQISVVCRYKYNRTQITSNDMINQLSVDILYNISSNTNNSIVSISTQSKYL